MNLYLKSIAVAAFSAILLLGCLNSALYTIDDEFDSSPIKTKTKMTAALQCLGDQLEKNLDDDPGAYIFMVRDITDGTINNNYSYDGPLSDAGRIQLISILTAHTKPSYGVVLDEFPLMLKPVINEQVGLNRFGVPSKTNLDSFITEMTQFTNENRKPTGMPAVKEVMPLVIDGSFTRYDSSYSRSKGYGRNAGYRSDAEDEDASVDFGNSGSERSVTLVVNVIDPKTNVVMGTEGFDLKFYSNSQTARFRVAVDEYYYGFSNTDVKVETVHTAQQILLEAGAIWILDNAYGSTVDFSPCFDTKEKLALGRDARTEQDKAQQVAMTPQQKAPTAQGKGGGIRLGGLVDIDLIDLGGVGRIPGTGNRPGIGDKAQSAESASESALGNGYNPDGTPVESPSNVYYSELGWQVRAGTYCEIRNADAVFKMLNRSGYNAQSIPVKIDECKGTRVWLGPYQKKETAEKISAELKIFTGENGYIVNSVN